MDHRERQREREVLVDSKLLLHKNQMTTLPHDNFPVSYGVLII